MINVVKKVVEEKLIPMNLEEFVSLVLDEDYYCLSMDNDEDMFDEFTYSCGDMVDEVELNANKEEIIKLLNKHRDTENQESYELCVDAARKFIEDNYQEHFWEECEYSIYGKKCEEVFNDAIKALYKKYCCNEEVE
jgi:hypothetical protein